MYSNFMQWLLDKDNWRSPVEKMCYHHGFRLYEKEDHLLRKGKVLQDTTLLWRLDVLKWVCDNSILRRRDPIRSRWPAPTAPHGRSDRQTHCQSVRFALRNGKSKVRPGRKFLRRGRTWSLRLVKITSPGSRRRAAWLRLAPRSLVRRFGQRYCSLHNPSGYGWTHGCRC